MIFFSIIIPCYNLEKYVHKTIVSVLKQNYENFELILIDDGSTDNTYKIIKSYEDKDKRVKVFTKQNGGVSSARNLGIKKAEGENILFLDGDDLIECDLLEKSYEVLKNKKIDMFSFGYKMVSEITNDIIKDYSCKKHANKLYSGNEFLELYFSKKINQCMCSFIVKKSIIKDNLILFDENTKYGEDQEFQIRCINQCTSVYYEGSSLFFYIQRKGSAINSRIVREDFDVYIRIEEYLSDNLKEYYSNYLCFLFIYYVREIINKGSERETVTKLLKLDPLLNHFKIKLSLYSMNTVLFILFYRIFIKRYLLRKYNIGNYSQA